MPGCIVNSSTRTESASTTVKTMVMPDSVRSGDRLVTTAVTTTPGVMMALTLMMVAPALMTSACVTAVVGVVVSLTVVVIFRREVAQSIVGVIGSDGRTCSSATFTRVQATVIGNIAQLLAS